ncbi:MAG: 30S ribosomal protein S19e [Candidatus Woesearchaeota archaeon]
MKAYDIKTDEVIKRTAEKLKKIEEIKAPEWSKFVKTSPARERPPVELDWWYARTASILRKIQLLGPIGTSKLSKKYGGKKNRGHKPEKFFRGSTKIIRTILQQLEKAGLTEQAQKGAHKGRIATKKGLSLLNTK